MKHNSEALQKIELSEVVHQDQQLDVRRTERIVGL
jgi:hypothetical protein